MTKLSPYLSSNQLSPPLPSLILQEADKLKGMKWLLAMLSKGRDMSDFFPDVVKNVVVKSVEVKKMIYIYVVHYADYDNQCRETALLSINSFQKDMSGTNQLIRGLALRVMTSIRVPDIIQIQLLAVRKCATDSSPYVRKCAAVALTKVFSLDPEQLVNLKQILEKLLKDSSTMVLGSAVAAFNEICPNSYEILHSTLRKLCHLLADMDEWTQVSVLEVLTRYVRNQFTDPAPGVAAAVRLQAKQRSSSAIKGRIGSTIKRRVVRKAFYSDEEDESDEEEVEVETKAEAGSVFAGVGVDEQGDIDPDHRLILRSSLPLLKSRNSGVVMSVCALHYYCGSQSSATNLQIGKALVRILRNHREIQYVVLSCISTMAQERPATFRPFISDFFIKGTDPVFNRLLKLEILTSICTKENIQNILKELQIYVKHGNARFVCAAIRAIGRVVDADPDIASKCMEGLMHLMLCNKTDVIVGEVTVVLRQLLQQNPSCESASKILHQLVKLLVIDKGGLDASAARSSIVWLVGEFHDVMAKVAPDVLRILAAGFMDESTETKTQILNFAIKLSLRLADEEHVQSMMQYVLEMARYDADTDLRDRSRFMMALMGLAPSTEAEGEAPAVDEEALEELNEHAMGIMLSPKLPPVTLLGSVDVEGLPNFNVGSLSSLIGHYISGYEPIASWPSAQPDSTVRDAVRLTADAASADPKWKAKGDDSSGSDVDGAGLANFYGEKDSDDDSDDDDSDDDEEEEEDDDDDDDDDDDSDDDDDDDDDDDEDDESEEESEEDSSDEEVARIPITQSKASQGMRQGMRKVVTAGKKGKSSGDDLSLLNDFEGLSTGVASSAGGMDAAPASSAPAPAPAPASAAGFDSLFGSPVKAAPVAALSPMTPQATKMGGAMDSIMGAFDAVPSQGHGQMGSMGGMGGMGGMGAMGSLSSAQLPSPTSLGQTMPPMAPMQAMPMQGQDMNMGMAGMGGLGGMGMGGMGGMGMMGGGMGMGGGMMGMMGQPMAPSGGMGVMAGGPGMRPAAVQAAPLVVEEQLSEPKLLLRPDLGGGLSVSIVFRFGVLASTYNGATCTYLNLRNCGDQPLRWAAKTPHVITARTAH